MRIITETKDGKEYRTQYADTNCWLFQDYNKESRYFTKKVLLGVNAIPWQECSDEEKIEWENAHKSEVEESQPIEQ